MKMFKNKLSIPVICGLVLVVLDLALWVWVVIYGFLHPYPGIWEEGLFGMLILHFPSSLILPFLGELDVSFSSNSLVPQFVIMFLAGLAQYFFLGYLIGSVIALFKEKFSRSKDCNQEKTDKLISTGRNIDKIRIILVNLSYLVFAIIIISLIRNYLSVAFSDFELFKKIYQISHLLFNGAAIILWLVFTFYFYKFEKKLIKQDKWNLVYMAIPAAVILISWIFIN